MRRTTSVLVASLVAACATDTVASIDGGPDAPGCTSAVDCPVNQFCGASGTCTADVCRPGAATCIDAQTVSVCREDGSGNDPSHTCILEETCVAGIGCVGHDAGSFAIDAGPPAIDAGPGTLARATTGSGPASTACIGAVGAPIPGPSASFTLSMLAFGQSGDAAPNVDACFCPDGVLSPEALVPSMGASCGTCQAIHTDATGHATVTAMRGGWYAFRVFRHAAPTAGTTFLDSVRVGAIAPASASLLETEAISQLTVNLIAAAELIEIAPSSTMVIGRVVDCTSTPLSNVIVRAFDASGTEILTGVQVDDPRYAYFDGAENPDSAATTTNVDGLYVVANAPSASSPLRIEAWAYTGQSPSGPAQRIGCEVVSALPNGVAFVDVGPLRNDYPAGHPCAL